MKIKLTMKIKLITLFICSTCVISCTNDDNTDNSEKTAGEKIVQTTELEAKPTTLPEPTADDQSTAKAPKKSTAENIKPEESVNQISYSFDNKSVFNKTSKIIISDQFTDYKAYVTQVKLPKTITVKEDKNTFSDEGETWSEPKLVILENEDVLFELTYVEEPESSKMKIDSIVIQSSSIKNIDGVGVDITVDDFIQTYPSAKLYYTYISDQMWLGNEVNNTKFIIKADEKLLKTLKVDSDLIILDPKILPKSQKISSIIIK